MRGMRVYKMIISLKVKPHAHENAVEQISDTEFVVKVRSPAEKGKANKDVIVTLAKYFHISSSAVQIVSGLTSQRKRVRIENI